MPWAVVTSTADVGQAVASILEAKRKAIETVDLEARGALTTIGTLLRRIGLLTRTDHEEQPGKPLNVPARPAV
jgi:hypothetical protein